MIRRVGYVVAVIGLWVANLVERVHARRARKWNRTHKGAVRTPRRPT